MKKAVYKAKIQKLESEIFDLKNDLVRRTLMHNKDNENNGLNVQKLERKIEQLLVNVSRNSNLYCDDIKETSNNLDKLLTAMLYLKEILEDKNKKLQIYYKGKE